MMRLFSLSVVTALAALVGCGGSSGPARAPVKGTVMVEGKGPLPGGSIQFISTKNPSDVAGGQIGPDGSFATDAPVGENKVTISNSHLRVAGKTNEKMNAAPKGLDVPGQGAGAASLKYVPISPAYSSADSTPLTVTVESGGTSKDFTVK